MAEDTKAAAVSTDGETPNTTETEVDAAATGTGGTPAPTAEEPADDTGLGLAGFLKSTPTPVDAEAKPAAESGDLKKTDTPPVKEASKESGGESAPPAPKADDDKAGFEKRYWDTQKWATQISQENTELKRNLEGQAKMIQKISKQLEGEWTQEDEDAFQQDNAQPSPEDQVTDANIKGRIDASRSAAFTIYGKETVEKLLYADDAPFRAIQDDPVVKAKVLSSEAPVIAAIQIVKARQFYDKWGYDPETIEANMRKTITAELKETITQEVMKGFTKQASLPQTLRDVRGSDAKNTVVAPPTKQLSELFAL
jgi:hypothetical protein